MKYHPAAGRLARSRPRPGESKMCAAALLVATILLGPFLGCNTRRPPPSSRELDPVARMPISCQSAWIGGYGNGYAAELMRLAATSRDSVVEGALTRELIRVLQEGEAYIGEMVSGGDIRGSVAYLPGSEIWLEQALPHAERMRHVGAYALMLVGDDASLGHAARFYASKLGDTEYCVHDHIRHPYPHRYSLRLQLRVPSSSLEVVRDHPLVYVTEEGKAYLLVDGMRTLLLEAGIHAVPALLELFTGEDVVVRLQALALIEHISGLPVELNVLDVPPPEAVNALRARLVAAGKYPTGAN